MSGYLISRSDADLAEALDVHPLQSVLADLQRLPRLPPRALRTGLPWYCASLHRHALYSAIGSPSSCSPVRRLQKLCQLLHCSSTEPFDGESTKGISEADPSPRSCFHSFRAWGGSALIGEADHSRVAGVGAGVFASQSRLTSL